MGASESCCGLNNPSSPSSFGHGSHNNNEVGDRTTSSSSSVEESSEGHEPPKKSLTSKTDPPVEKKERSEEESEPPKEIKKEEVEKKVERDAKEDGSDEKKKGPPPPERPKNLKMLEIAKLSVSSKQNEDEAEVSDMLSKIEMLEMLQTSLGGNSKGVPAVVKKVNTKKKAEERKKALKFSTKSDDGASHDAELLIYICGDGGVGKTCVAHSFSQCGYFDGDALPTMFDTHDVFCTFTMKGKPVRVKLRIVDTAGQHDLYKTFFEAGKAAVKEFADDKTCDKKGIVFFLCYSAAGMTKSDKKAAKTSFKNTLYDPEDTEDGWVSSIEKVAKNNDDEELRCKSTSIVLVGTKDDFKDDEQRVTKESEVIKACANLGDNLEGDYKISHGYCSALLDYDSVKTLFAQAAGLALGDQI